MSKLEKLIQELCPDGVPFKPIKEVYKRLKGTPITAGKMKEIDTPCGEIKVFPGLPELAPEDFLKVHESYIKG